MFKFEKIVLFQLRNNHDAKLCRISGVNVIHFTDKHTIITDTSSLMN